MALKAGERKKQQILIAVLEVIARDGVEAVTHRSVGLQTGVSHGVVSYHFPTRDSLILDSFKFYFGSFNDLMKEAGWLAHEAMKPDQIAHILTKAISMEMANPLAILVEQELILVAARRPDLAELYRDWEEIGLNIFTAGLKISGYKQSQQLARVILNFMRGFLLETLTDPSLTKQDFYERALFLVNLHSSDNNDQRIMTKE